MKKTLAAFLFAFMMLTLHSWSFFALSEGTDYSAMTDDELREMQVELRKVITAVSLELGSRSKEAQDEMVVNGTMTLREIFQSIDLAKYIRDKCGLVSIDQPVTQEDLDRITEINSFGFENAQNVESLVGIGHLRNLKTISGNDFDNLSTLPDELCMLTNLDSIVLFGTNVSNLPEKIGDLTALRWLDLRWTKISELPESIVNLSSLKTLSLESTNISKLPDNINSLTSLERLNIANTNVSELPNSIGSLSSLKQLDISHTKISILPVSIYELSLDEFKKNGLDID